jgi:hypothetical protein
VAGFAKGSGRWRAMAADCRQQPNARLFSFWDGRALYGAEMN